MESSYYIIESQRNRPAPQSHAGFKTHAVPEGGPVSHEESGPPTQWKDWKLKECLKLSSPTLPFKI
jgi:hypothetical protein